MNDTYQYVPRLDDDELNEIQSKFLEAHSAAAGIAQLMAAWGDEACSATNRNHPLEPDHIEGLGVSITTALSKMSSLFEDLDDRYEKLLRKADDEVYRARSEASIERTRRYRPEGEQ